MVRGHDDIPLSVLCGREIIRSMIFLPLSENQIIANLDNFSLKNGFHDLPISGVAIWWSQDIPSQRGVYNA